MIIIDNKKTKGYFKTALIFKYPYFSGILKKQMKT